MFQVQILVVLSSLTLIYFLVTRFRFDTIVNDHCYSYGYHHSNSKQISCDHNPSACGGTAINLKCPFRFKGDDHPDLCSDPDTVEVSCENNRTVLPLSEDSYFDNPHPHTLHFYADVRSFDYGKYTFRIFDPGVQKNNCSTLPIYSFMPSNYFYEGQVGDTQYERIVDVDQDQDTHPLIFVSCKNPVKSKSPLYIDTASCNITADRFAKEKAPSDDYYSYVVVGKNLVASDIEDSCTIYKMVRADLRCLPKLTGDISFQDIHNLLANGFELDWYPHLQTTSRSFLCECSTHFILCTSVLFGIDHRVKIHFGKLGGNTRKHSQ